MLPWRPGRRVMREFADIERRIERLCSPASYKHADSWLLAELRDVLAIGYAAAHSADARSRRLGEQVNQLVDNADVSGGGDTVRLLAQERRRLDEATHQLRDRLTLVRELLISVSGRSGSV